MTEAAPSPVLPGDLIAGKYRAERVLGTGGMGVVVAAQHVQLGQRVALKFLLPAGIADPLVVARFEREARAAAQLRSEHVARVLDVGHMDSGAPYIVMELLEGSDLGDLLSQSGPLEESQAVDYLLQACEAIAEAHNAGIVHRDLKPKNLFVTRRVDGWPLVKVLDFGISKVKDSADFNLTGTSEIIGSPNYMSPEQLRASRDVDLRSDIWSIGAILYELLGGRVPFVAETLTQLCSMVLTEAPRPLSELREGIHPELQRVISRCLEKSASDRYANVGELAVALAPFATAHGSALASRVAMVAVGAKHSPPEATSSPRVTTPPGANGSTSVSWGNTSLASPQPRRALLLGAAIGAVLVGGGAVAFLGSPSHPPTAPGAEGIPSSVTDTPRAFGSPAASTASAASGSTATAAPPLPPVTAPSTGTRTAGPEATPSSPTAGPVRGPRHPAKPGSDTRPVAANPGGDDDLPADRK